MSIALCMIVRDESAVIGRCLESVRPLIDSWIVCDTGSSDGTPELVEQALAGVPGDLHRRPWRDFGWNRSELMTLARDSADYLLLVDADMTVELRGELPPLSADTYLLRHAGDLSYWVPRLVRGRRRWWFVGSTHEYLTGEGDWSEDTLEALVIHHHADGSSRATKLERDTQLLNRDLQDDPNNPRVVFYLAQTLRDLGQEASALELYERRTALAGWAEERFYAAYQAGSLRVRRDDDRAIAGLLSAWEQRPQRSEPLFELARFCRFRGWHQLAYLFASRGAELSPPAGALFVHQWVYEWGLLFELAQAAYWIGEVQQAIDICDALLAKPNLPAEIAAATQETRAYCGLSGGARQGSSELTRGGRFALLQSLLPSFDVAEIQLEVEPAWPRFNPTIAADSNGFRMIVRTANYLVDDGQWRFVEDGESVIRTINYLVRLSNDLEVQEISALVDLSDGPRRYPSRFEGYEDCRLVRIAGRWFASATVRDRNPRERCQMALLELQEEKIVSVRTLNSPIPAEHEKNWMPLSTDDDLRFVYRCLPTLILDCDLQTGFCPLRVSHATPWAGELRGGSQAVAIDEGILCVVHQAFDEGGRRRYGHRFVLMDNDYRVTHVSPEFGFLSHGLEFCAGLASRGDQLVLSFGIGDRAAMLAVVETNEILEMLDPLDPLAQSALGC